MNNLYVLQLSAEMVIISANSVDSAFDTLLEYEDSKECRCFAVMGAKEQIKQIGLTYKSTGVLNYYAI